MKALFLAFVLLCSVTTLAKEPTPVDYPAIAQKTEWKKLPLSLYKVLDIIKTDKMELWIATDDKRDSHWLRSLLNKKKIAARYDNLKDDANGISNYRDELTKLIDIHLIDATKPEQCRAAGIDYFKAHKFPLVRFSKGDKWEEFPDDDRLTLMYPITTLQWVHTQLLIHENALVFTHSGYYSTYAHDYSRSIIWNKYFDENKRAYLFLLNNGVHPHRYLNSSRPNNINNFSFNYLKHDQHEIEIEYWHYEQNDDGEYSVSRKKKKRKVWKYIVFSDVNFDLIKKDFPDFQMPVGYVEEKLDAEILDIKVPRYLSGKNYVFARSNIIEKPALLDNVELPDIPHDMSIKDMYSFIKRGYSNKPFKNAPANAYK